MYHLDRTLDIHPTLHAWATIVSQPYIIKHAPDFLEINTLLSSSFKGMIADDMDMTDEDPASWQTVGTGKSKSPKRVSHQDNRQYSDNPSQQKRVRPPLTGTPTSTPAETGSILTPLTRPKSILHRPKCGTLPRQPQTAPVGTNSRDSTSPAPAAPPKPIPPSPKVAKIPDQDTVATDDSDMKQSAFKSNLNVRTHDGTQRITIRWTPGNKDLSHTQNPGEWMKAALTMIQDLLPDECGVMYRWESIDLATWKSASTMHADELREYVSPSIHYLKTMGTFVFGLRFGNTPFFDIVLVKRTPLEQLIPHLAIQCGENHVAPLSKQLSAILSGNGSAVFLPRVVLGTITTEQITRYFQAHDDYMKSLRTVCLSTMISNLDTLRKETLTSGEVIQRSTRGWATSLVLSSTGRSARCDIVNGGTDHAANLLVPGHVYQEVLTEVSAYKLRINPLAKRETRFRDKIPGLPSVIQIDTSIQQSLDCLELMSSEEIWKRAPSTVRPDPTKNQQSSRAAPTASFPRGSSVTSKISDPSDPSPEKSPPLGKSKKCQSKMIWKLSHAAMTIRLPRSRR